MSHGPPPLIIELNSRYPWRPACHGNCLQFCGFLTWGIGGNCWDTSGVRRGIAGPPQGCGWESLGRLRGAAGNRWEGSGVRRRIRGACQRYYWEASGAQQRIEVAAQNCPGAKAARPRGIPGPRWGGWACAAGCPVGHHPQHQHARWRRTSCPETAGY